MVLTAEQQRAKRGRLNYGRNTIGELVRKKAFWDCDYTPEGHLKEFDDEDGLASCDEQASVTDATRTLLEPAIDCVGQSRKWMRHPAQRKGRHCLL